MSRKVKRRIPKWYLELLTKYPLVDLEIRVPNNHGDETLIGKPMEELPLLRVTFISTSEIEEHALNIFPDCELLRREIIRIVEDKYVTQEGVFTNGKQDKPEVRPKRINWKIANTIGGFYLSFWRYTCPYFN